MTSPTTILPLVIDASQAHQNGVIVYGADGTITFSHQQLEAKWGVKTIEIPAYNQFSLIRSTFDDLSTALSSLSNSPRIGKSMSLRTTFDQEVLLYEKLVTEALSLDKFEPDYGTYVFDWNTRQLFLIAPQYWHRLAIVTSNSKLLTDPKNELTWEQIRNTLEGKVVGFAGASVGGGVLEGWLREARPLRAKIADPDWVSITNLNRGERMSIRHGAQSRAMRPDIKNPFYVPRVNKAEYLAYEESLVDPYCQFDIYSTGLTDENIEQFILGDGKNEPPIDLFVEEVDDFWLKFRIRELCKKHKIPVIMMSDFGNRVQGQLHNFKRYPELAIGYTVPDSEVRKLVEQALTSGERSKVWDFVKALCGDDFATDEFLTWVNGEGEQPTASLPQSGATAMVSGGVGGKVIAMYFLGYDIPARFIYDLKRFTALLG